MSRDIFNWTRLLRAPSNLAFSVSRDAASTTSLGSLCQCFISLVVKKFFLISSQNPDSRKDRAFVAACLWGRRSGSVLADCCSGHCRVWGRPVCPLSLPSHPSTASCCSQGLGAAVRCTWMQIQSNGPETQILGRVLRWGRVGPAHTRQHSKLPGPYRGKSGRLHCWQHWASSPRLYRKNECKNKTSFVWLVKHK